MRLDSHEDFKQRTRLTSSFRLQSIKTSLFRNLPVAGTQNPDLKQTLYHEFGPP